MLEIENKSSEQIQTTITFYLDVRLSSVIYCFLQSNFWLYTNQQICLKLSAHRLKLTSNRRIYKFKLTIFFYQDLQGILRVFFYNLANMFREFECLFDVFVQNSWLEHFKTFGIYRFVDEVIVVSRRSSYYVSINRLKLGCLLEHLSNI